MLLKLALLLCATYAVFGYPLQDSSQEILEDERQHQIYYYHYPHPENLIRTFRVRRSPFVEGEPQYGQNPGNNKNKNTWEVQPDLRRDQNGNTKGRVEIQRHGENHELNAGWEQTIRGPNKHSESWHVGGKFGW